MNIFKKKETLSQNITFMAIMAALNVIFVLLSEFIPFLLFILVFLLPLSCTLVILLCNKKYFPIFFFSTIGLCFIVVAWNISDTIFFIIPSLITGLVFGLMIEKKLPIAFSIIAATATQFCLTYLSVPLIELITQINILTSFEKIFNVNESPDLLYYELTGVFVVSFAQEIVSYLFIRFGLKSLHLLNENHEYIMPCLIGLIVNLLLTLLSVFIYPYVSFIFFLTSIYFSVFVFMWLITINKRINYWILIASFFINLFLLAGIYAFISSPFHILIFEVFEYVLCAVAFFNYLLIKK